MNEVSTIERSGKTLAIREPPYVSAGKTAPQAVNGAPKSEPRNSPLVPNDSGLLPGMDDPKAMKQLLEDEDVDRYLQLQGTGQ